MKTITAAGHEGCRCRLGSSSRCRKYKIELHDWDVDFASWCSYKYMNSGPGMLLMFCA
jgi:kynureninase